MCRCFQPDLREVLVSNVDATLFVAPSQQQIGFAQWYVVLNLAGQWKVSHRLKLVELRHSW